MQSLEIEINRCLKPAGTIGLPQIHAFADAGDHAYGACVFIRWNTTEGINVKLISSKAFVAPLKQKTTPQLELMGTIAMSRLTTTIMSALNFEVEYKLLSNFVKSLTFLNVLLTIILKVGMCVQYFILYFSTYYSKFGGQF